MTNAMCAGDQDRNTTTSETNPKQPPRKTKNCYLSNQFDRSNCGTSDDKACFGVGGPDVCTPDSRGGYCLTPPNRQINVARGNIFIPLRPDQLIDRYKSDDDQDEIDRSINRALNQQRMKITNKIRESQILNNRQNTSTKENNDKNNDKNNEDNNEVHGFVSDLLVKIGIGFSVIMVLISLSILMIQNKII